MMSWDSQERFFSIAVLEFIAYISSRYASVIEGATMCSRVLHRIDVMDM